MRRLNRLHLEFPFAGSRMLRGLLVAEGCLAGAAPGKSKGFLRGLLLNASRVPSVATLVRHPSPIYEPSISIGPI
jgi:hypothetical protein